MKPPVLPLTPEAIPPELRKFDAWVGYRLVLKDARWTKEPINIRTGDLAKSNKYTTWTDFSSAVEGYKRHGCDVIGLCRTEDLVFIDLDVLDENGNLRPYPWAEKILSTVGGRAYVEKSATGTGIHAICRGTLPKGRRQWDHRDKEHTGFALYDAHRVFAFTGCTMPESGEIADLTAELANLHQVLLPTPKRQRNASQVAERCVLSDDELLDRAGKARNCEAFSRLFRGDWQGGKYASHSEADLALCSHLAFWTGGDPARVDALFRKSGMHREEKWEREDYRYRTIALAIERKDEVYDQTRRTLQSKKASKASPTAGNGLAAL